MIGSLFSGIGGLERGLERAGLGSVAWQVEIDPFCRGVLARHWPEAVRHEDVRAVGAAVLPRVSVICGGFPCQDVSVAGRGAGLAGARSGLWFEFLRIVSELRPRGVVIENVAGLVRRGLDTVIAGLAALGYSMEATRLRASDLGAPHHRERLFVLAYADRGAAVEPGRIAGARGAGTAAAGDGGPMLAGADGMREPQPRGGIADSGGRPGDGDTDLGHTHGLRRRPWEHSAQATKLSPASGADRRGGAGPQPRVGGDAYGLSPGLAWPAGRGADPYAWEPPRTIPARSLPDRGRRIKALGNAVVSAQAEIAGRRLVEIFAAQDAR